MPAHVGLLCGTELQLEFSRFRRSRIVLVAATLLLSAVVALYFFTRSTDPPALAFSEFLKAVDTGNVAAVTFADPVVDITLTDGRVARTVAPKDYLAANGSFVTDLYRRNVRVDVVPAPEPGSLSWGATATVAAFPWAARLHGLSDHGRAHPVHLRPSSRCRQGRARHHLSGRCRRRRGQGRGQGNRRFPTRTCAVFGKIGGRIPKGILLSARLEPEKRFLRDRLPVKRACRFSSRAARLRRDVCRCRRLPRAQIVPRRAAPRLLHCVHRRARRCRPQSRRQLAQPRGTRADAQPAAGRDGRLRSAPGHRRRRRDQST